MFKKKIIKTNKKLSTIKMDPCLPSVNMSNIMYIFREGRKDFPLETSWGAGGERERERENVIVPHLIVCVTKLWCQPHADYLSCYIKCSPAVPIACPYPVVCILLHKMLSCTTDVLCQSAILCYHAPSLRSPDALCFHAYFCPHLKSHLMIKTKQEYFSLNSDVLVTL